MAVAGPSGSARTWAVEFLTAIGEPVTGCNVGAITAWEAAEGGGVTNDAAYNPLNTARLEPGSWTVNSAGVQAFPSWSEGLAANVAAITNGLYGPVLAALRAGNDAQGVADAVGASPWGTSPFTAALSMTGAPLTITGRDRPGRKEGNRVKVHPLRRAAGPPQGAPGPAEARQRPPHRR